MADTGDETMTYNRRAMEPAPESEARQIALLAIGRVLRLMTRPTQPGDIEMYETCKSIVLDYAEIHNGFTATQR